MDNTKISVKKLLMNEYEPPYSSKEFYSYSKKFKCEELIDYVMAIYHYQADYELAAQPDQDIHVSNGSIDKGVIRDHKIRLTIVDKTKRFLKRLSGRVDEQPALTVVVEPVLKSDKNKTSNRSSYAKNVEDKLTFIINKYVRSTSPKQINIPFHINDNLIKNYEAKIRGPLLFEDSLDHCEMILKTSLLPNFTLERKSNPLVLRKGYC